MKVITTNRLNRFWKNGVLPIKNSLASKLNTANIVNNLLTTAAGYALDARQGKALDDKITALNGKSTKDVTATINGLSCNISLAKVGKMVFCKISASGGITANQASASNVIPSEYRPCFSAILTAKNVTAASYGTNHSTTRYIIKSDGTVEMLSDNKGALERSISGCWLTN